MRKKYEKLTFLRKVPVLIVTLFIVLLATSAFSELDSAGSGQATERLEEALRRGAVTCYASEGIYPPTLDYLVRNYDIKIDEERYIVHYDVFASNIMPDITVIEK